MMLKILHLLAEVKCNDAKRIIAEINTKHYFFTFIKIFLLYMYKLFSIFKFLGNALLRRLVRIGVLDESRMKLDYVLGLKIEDFLERRLQTQVFKLGLAKSIHHARVLIRQRHIR